MDTNELKAILPKVDPQERAAFENAYHTARLADAVTALELTVRMSMIQITEYIHRSQNK